MAEDTVPQETNGIDPDGTEEIDAVADRLEAALDRIARRLDAAKPAPPSAKPPAELLERLDGLIGRLREVLGSPSGPSQD